MLRNRAFWAIADERGKTGGLSDTQLRSLDRSFSRASRRLEQEEILRVYRRKLETLEDFVRDYPLRTKNPRIRELRQIFVPLLADLMSERAMGGTSTKGERYLIDRSMETDSSWFERAQRDWFSFERRLLTDARDLAADRAKALVEALAKGREYFEGRRKSLGGRSTRSTSPIKLPARSLHGLVAAMNDAGYDTSEIEAWYGAAFPQPALQHVELKVALHEVAFLGQRATPALKGDTKLWLLEREPEAVRALPGHEEPGRTPGVPRWASRNVTEFSPLLDRVIDRHVFDRFDYLTRL